MAWKFHGSKWKRFKESKCRHKEELERDGSVLEQRREEYLDSRPQVRELLERLEEDP